MASKSMTTKGLDYKLYVLRTPTPPSLVIFEYLVEIAIHKTMLYLRALVIPGTNSTNMASKSMTTKGLNYKLCVFRTV